MSDETKLYNFRLPIGLMDRVKTAAANRGLRITDVVLGTFQMIDFQEDLLHPFQLAKAGNSLVDAFVLPLSAVTKDRDQALARILGLTGDAAETVRKLRDLLDQTEDERQSLNRQLSGAYLERDERDVTILALRDEVIAMKKALASKPEVQALRVDPKIRAVVPMSSGGLGPILPSTVPSDLSGEARGFNLKGKKSP